MKFSIFIERINSPGRAVGPILSMEGIRGFAVFLVFCVHYSSLVEPFVFSTDVLFLRNIHSLGNLGVDLFFVLSGYLIYGAVVKSTSFRFKEFYIRRFFRIYPVFLFVISLYIVLTVFFPSQSKFPDDFFDSIIYLFSNLLLLPGLFDIEPIVSVSWSLSYEAFYYIMLPVVVVFFRINLLRLSYRLFILSSFFVFLFFVLSYFSLDKLRILMFFSGIFIFELRDDFKIKVPSFFGFFIFVPLLYVFVFGNDNIIFYVFLSFLCFLFSLISIFEKGSMFYRFFSFYAFRWLGNMSYSYYLIHGLSLKFLFLILEIIGFEGGFPFLYYLLVIPCFVFTIVPALFLYFFIEYPFSISKKYSYLGKRNNLNCSLK